MPTKQPGHTVRAFTLIESLIVVAIMGVLIAMVSLSTVNWIETARAENALNQIGSIFRAAHRAALAVNEPRRVVICLTYPELPGATSLSAYYAAGVRVQFWADKPVNPRKARDIRFWEKNYSPPVTDVQTLPAGVSLIDIDGVPAIPTNTLEGAVTEDGQRQVYWIFDFEGSGRLKEYYRDTTLNALIRDQRETFESPALHFSYNGTFLDMSDATPAVGSLDYVELLKLDPRSVSKELELIAGPKAEVDHQFRARTQIHTLRVLRLTGQVKEYDYAIYTPWTRRPLPDGYEEWMEQ